MVSSEYGHASRHPSAGSHRSGKHYHQPPLSLSQQCGRGLSPVWPESHAGVDSQEGGSKHIEHHSQKLKIFHSSEAKYALPFMLFSSSNKSQWCGLLPHKFKTLWCAAVGLRCKPPWACVLYDSYHWTKPQTGLHLCKDLTGSSGFLQSPIGISRILKEH
jgi:hypothetical protein